jgi:hypothetical protein
VATLLAAADVLIAGPYRRDLPEPRRRWIGSSNQVVHFLTPRYRADDPRFAAGNTVELRLRAGRLEVNGWPAAADRVLAERGPAAGAAGPAAVGAARQAAVGGAAGQAGAAGGVG